MSGTPALSSTAANATWNWRPGPTGGLNNVQVTVYDDDARAKQEVERRRENLGADFHNEQPYVDIKYRDGSTRRYSERLGGTAEYRWGGKTPEGWNIHHLSFGPINAASIEGIQVGLETNTSSGAEVLAPVPVIRRVGVDGRPTNRP